MSLFQALPGFRDFYPEECSVRDYLFKIWRECSQKSGFSPYDGPPLETLELYKAKSGDEILGQLYHFKDKGDREITLRPEMTPTLARMAGKKQRDYKKPLKWYSIPQLFRYERAQRGRLREHFQWNADIIGESETGAEVELMGLIASSLRQLGLGPEDIVFRVSDRMYWIDFLNKNNVPESKHYDFLQALDKIERTEEKVTREKLGGLADKVFEVFEKQDSSERLDLLMERGRALGIGDFLEVDLKIVRGLAYYTGVVFEVHDRKGELRAIAGGGRYDGLLKLLSDVDLPAAGFGMGDVVILELLKDKNLVPQLKAESDFFVVVGNEAYRNEALELVAFLRKEGFSADYPLSEMKFGKQMELAEVRGASYAMIVDEGVKNGKVGIKDLKKREQKEFSFTKENSGFKFSPSLPISSK